MSELKAFITREGLEAYIKSEADKVIADKDAEIAELKDIDSKNRSAYYKDLAMMAKDVEHHKYKRCLAMKKWCLYWANYWRCCQPTDCGMFMYKANFFRKWQKRWRKLADKFKPNNSTAQ